MSGGGVAVTVVVVVVSCDVVDVDAVEDVVGIVVEADTVVSGFVGACGGRPFGSAVGATVVGVAVGGWLVVASVQSSPSPLLSASTPHGPHAANVRNGPHVSTGCPTAVMIYPTSIRPSGENRMRSPPPGMLKRKGYIPASVRSRTCSTYATQDVLVH